MTYRAAEATGANPGSARDQLVDRFRELAGLPQGARLAEVARDGRTAPLLGLALFELICNWAKDELPEFPQAIGSLAPDADPISAAIMHAAAGQLIRSLTTFALLRIRMGSKLQYQIEGPRVAGRRVLLVAGMNGAIGCPELSIMDCLRERGAIVMGVVSVMNLNAGTRDVVLGWGLPYRCLFELDDLGLDPQ